MKNLIFKTIFIFLVLFAVTLNAQNQNFSHIKTFGFDYIRVSGNEAFIENLEWITARHDWIVGPTALWPPMGTDYLDSLTYNTIKGVNPDARIMKYLPYHSISPVNQNWLEAWCTANGKDPEKIYYHYYFNTTIRLANGDTLTIPGYGGGAASSLEEARLRVRWNGGWVGINPSSQTFREAYQALALFVISLEGSTDIFADGLFLDTFGGIVEDGYWNSFLENTIELKDIGTTEEIYTQARSDLANSKVELENFLIQSTGNQSFRVNVNAAEIAYIYNTHSELYNEEHRDKLMDLSIEYLVTSTTNSYRIPLIQQVYDDMDNGRMFFIRSQTNFGPPTEIPFGFIQFILSTHYLINHPNARFMFHKGNAGNYGGYPYGYLEPTHWHPNMEVDIGQPVIRQQDDYWGASGSDRFFIFAEGSDYTILGREYDNAIVLAKFSLIGGWANIGNNPTTHDLGDEYYPLLVDNTTASAVTNVTLGTSEGIILLKTPLGASSINEAAENEIQIYPNPVKNIITINFKGQPFENYRIFNATGQVVQADSFGNENQIYVSNLSKGVYFLELTSNQKKLNVKFIKK